MWKNCRARLLPVRSVCRGALTLGLASVLAAQIAGTASEVRVLIVRPIDSSRLLTLAGNTRSEANPRNDLGRVADAFAMDHMLLQLQRSPEREQAFKSFIDQQHDSASPNFHKWLTAVQVGQTYGPASRDIDTVSEWLRSSGFTVNTVYPSGMLIDFSGTAGQVSAAFHTEIHRLAVDGKNHIANMSDPRIPEALAPVVVGIVSLHDFRPRSMHKPRVQYTATSNGVVNQLMAPADLATIYDLNPAFKAGYTGKGQTIALLEDTNLYSTEDWNTFRQVFGLSSYASGTLSTIHPAPTSGGSNCLDPGVNFDDDEAALDVEWASAAAPDATIQLVSCEGTMTTIGVLFAAQNLINGSSPPQIISISYGICEAFNGVAANAAYNSAYQQAVSEGVSVFVAAGDEGAASCDSGVSAATHGIGVNGFATTPYNVAVGGTDFGDTYQGTNNTYWNSGNSLTYGSAISYIPEIPWNGSCAGSILAVFLGYSVGYGPSGFCGSDLAQQSFAFTTGAGSGGPSGCATGAPAANLVVGGSCQGYSKPAWQTGVPGIPNDSVRGIPDVSLFASNGIWGHSYLFCFSDPANFGAPCVGPPIDWAPGGGGTSYAAPIMAGIQALVNQKMGGAQGNPNPVYYNLAASSVASSVFHGITTGDIAVNCSGEIDCFGNGFVGRGRATPTTEFNGNGGLSATTNTYTPAFAAGQGWSFATGLGSVDAYNLIMNWSKGQ
jgi:subtilase family serine protease